MQKTNVKALVEAGAMASIAAITGLVSAIIPLILPLIPVPITLLGFRQGLKWSTMATIIAGIIIAMLTDPIRGIKVVSFCFIGLALGQAFRKNYSAGYILAWGSAAAVIGLSLYTLITAVLLGFNPFDIDTNQLNKTLLSVIQIYRGLGLDEYQLEQVYTIGLSIIGMMKLVVPASFLATGVFFAVINFAIVRTILKKLGQQVQYLPPFRLWQLPRFVLLILAIGTAAAFFGEKYNIYWLMAGGKNFQIVGLFLTFIQGLAVFYFLADKYNLSRLFRGFILLMILALPYPIIYAGVFDLAIDYRRLRTHHSS